MGIMAGLLQAQSDLPIATDIRSSYWRWLLASDLFYLNFLKDARFTRSNDLLYVYCTEYNLTDIVGQMHPNSSTFSSFKLRMNPYLLKFYNACVEKRLTEMFRFYKAAIETIIQRQDNCFYGSKVLDDELKALVKAENIDDIFNQMDDVYLTLKNYMKLQNNQTTEMLPNETVKGFLSKLENILLIRNEGLNDDQYRRKICRAVEIANLFISYSGQFRDAELVNREYSWGDFDNRALVSYDQLWKYMSRAEGISAIVQKGLPYRHIDIDAAVCIFPESTNYPLLQQEFTKQGRPSNPTSEHLINDWLMHWFFVDSLTSEKRREDRWKSEE